MGWYEIKVIDLTEACESKPQYLGHFSLGQQSPKITILSSQILNWADCDVEQNGGYGWLDQLGCGQAA